MFNCLPGTLSERAKCLSSKLPATPESVRSETNAKVNANKRIQDLEGVW